MESLLGSKQFCVYFHYDSVANEIENSKLHLKILYLMYNNCKKKCYRLKSFNFEIYAAQSLLLVKVF